MHHRSTLPGNVIREHDVSVISFVYYRSGFCVDGGLRTGRCTEVFSTLYFRLIWACSSPLVLIVADFFSSFPRLFLILFLILFSFFLPSCICIWLCVLWIPMSIRGSAISGVLFFWTLTHCMASISGLIRVAFVFLGSIYYYLSSIIFPFPAVARISLNNSLHYTTSSYLFIFCTLYSHKHAFSGPSFTSFLYSLRACLFLRIHPSAPLSDSCCPHLLSWPE
ncbi:hypothetical protein BDW68DRAFT_51660 [Aspergillus falconensis]